MQQPRWRQCPQTLDGAAQGDVDRHAQLLAALLIAARVWDGWVRGEQSILSGRDLASRDSKDVGWVGTQCHRWTRW